MSVYQRKQSKNVRIQCSDNSSPQKSQQYSGKLGIFSVQSVTHFYSLLLINHSPSSRSYKCNISVLFRWKWRAYARRKSLYTYDAREALCLGGDDDISDFTTVIKAPRERKSSSTRLRETEMSLIAASELRSMNNTRIYTAARAFITLAWIHNFHMQISFVYHHEHRRFCARTHCAEQKSEEEHRAASV